MGEIYNRNWSEIKRTTKGRVGGGGQSFKKSAVTKNCYNFSIWLLAHDATKNNNLRSGSVALEALALHAMSI